MFAAQILEGKPHLPIMTNHPKQGGIASFLSALAGIYLSGKDLQWPEPNSAELSEAFRAGPIEAHRTQTTVSNTTDYQTSTKIDSQPSKIVATSSESSSVITQVSVSLDEAITNYVGDSLAPLTGYPAKFCSGMVNLRALLGLSDSQINHCLLYTSDAADD